MQVHAVTAVVALGQVVGLRGAGREPHGGALPGIVREVGVEHLLGMREVSSVLVVELVGTGEHLVPEHGRTLIQVVLQVHSGGAQGAGARGGVEVGHLRAGLVAPGARVDLPASGVRQLLGIVCGRCIVGNRWIIR